MVFGGVNIEQELESHPLYSALKKKHPRKYQQVVRELEGLEKRDDFSSIEIITISQQRLTPIINKIIIEAGDGARGKYTTAYVKNIQLLKDRDETACYDAIFDPEKMSSKLYLLEKTTKDSGMEAAVIAAINDNGVDKSVVLKKVMEQTLTEVYQEIATKYGENSYLLNKPEKAEFTSEKRMICDMTIDLYKKLNTNNKAKKTTLRDLMKRASNL